MKSPGLATPTPNPDDASADLTAVVELAATYAARGAVVDTVELGDLVRRRRPAPESGEIPDVVHVLATVDLVGGNVVIDSGATPRGGRPSGFGLDQLSVTVLGDFLATMSNESFGPAVVVETPWRPSRAESARSLLLRNVLGQALLGLGRTEAVLCTGGASPVRQRAHRQELADALVGRADLAQVAARIQTGAEPGAELEDAVSLLGSALFSQRSPRTLFAVGCR